MKEPNLWIVGIEEGDVTQVNGTETIFNKIIKNFLAYRERWISKYKKYTGHQIVWIRKEIPATHNNQNTNHTEQKQNTKRE